MTTGSTAVPSTAFPFPLPFTPLDLDAWDFPESTLADWVGFFDVVLVLLAPSDFWKKLSRLPEPEALSFFLGVFLAIIPGHLLAASRLV